MPQRSVKVQGYILKELLKRLKHKCVSREQSQSQALEEAISDWLNDEGAE